MRNLNTDSDTLQALFNGLFSQVGFVNPSTVVGCYDSSSATLTVTSLGSILQQIANNNLVAAGNTAKNYVAQLPQAVQTCLTQNGEILQLLRKLQIAGLSLKDVATRIGQYAAAHLVQLHHDDVIANSDFIAAFYAGVGQELGVILQKIFVAQAVRLDAY